MMFDLASGGHHATYIRHLIEHWHKVRYPNKILFFVVSPSFLERHSDVVKLSSDSAQFIAISDVEAQQLDKKRSIVERAFLEWNLHHKYAIELNISHSLLMYFDHLQLPIAFGQESPCDFSGIYFRPRFHYIYFDGHVNNLKDSWHGWCQRLLLFIVLKNRRLSGLLSLDSYAIQHIQAISCRGKHIKYLPDPVYAFPVERGLIENFKQKLGIEKGRKVFLLFGRLTKRKGIYQALQAIKSLDSNISSRCCFILAGEIPKYTYSSIANTIKILTQESSSQIIIRNEYQSEEDVALYFSSADVILAPYQYHVGMSGVLMLASAYRKPILSSEYGLLGKLVKDYKLGKTCKSTSPGSIAQAISSFFVRDDPNCIDLSEISRLADSSHPSNFSKIIFEAVV